MNVMKTENLMKMNKYVKIYQLLQILYVIYMINNMKLKN